MILAINSKIHPSLIRHRVLRPQEAPEIENPIWIWSSLLENEMDTYIKHLLFPLKVSTD